MIYYKIRWKTKQKSLLEKLCLNLVLSRETIDAYVHMYAYVCMYVSRLPHVWCMYVPLLYVGTLSLLTLVHCDIFVTLLALSFDQHFLQQNWYILTVFISNIKMCDLCLFKTLTGTASFGWYILMCSMVQGIVFFFFRKGNRDMYVYHSKALIFV